MRSLILAAAATVAAAFAGTTAVEASSAFNTHAVGHHSSAKSDYRACRSTICKGPSQHDGAVASADGNDLTGKYPWWTGVELGTANAKIKIEAWLSFTCPDCADHWKNVWKPLIAKYGDRVSFVHQPFALPYQPYSYDATQASFAVYRLKNNDPKAFIQWADAMFTNQMIVYNAYELTTKQMWTTFASWAEPMGLKTADVINAMNGTVTTANYDAWYSARFARQRTLPGAPTFIVNDWLPFDLDVGSWTVADWSKWIDANI